MPTGNPVMVARLMLDELVEEFTKKALRIMGCGGIDQRCYLDGTFREEPSVRSHW